MKKAILYPFSYVSTVIIRYKEIIEDIDITSCIVPSASIYEKTDVSFYDEGCFANVPVYSYLQYDDILEEIDTVIWSEYNYIQVEDFLNSVVDDIKVAIRKKKNIICLQKLSHEKKEEMIKYAKYYGVDFLYYDYFESEYTKFYSNELSDINVPVIMVYGMLENTMKFNTQLSLKNILTKEGYKITQIGTKHYSKLFNIHPYPEFMFADTISDRLKILYFNKYVHEIIKKEKPDICVIGVPGEVIPYNNKFGFNFGVMAYLVSYAVKSDYTILNNHYMAINDDYIEGLKNIFKYRYANELSSIGISNISVNTDSYQNNEPEYEYEIVKTNEYDYKEYNSLNLQVFNITSQKYEEELLHNIYEKLSDVSERIN